MLWRSVSFRWAAYVLARAIGEARLWLGSGWRPLALGLAGVVVGLWFVRFGWPPRFRELITWAFVSEVVVVYALLWLIVRAYSTGSERLVVLATVNHAGKDFNSFAAGLSAHLSHQLGQLSELYKTIDTIDQGQRQSEENLPELKVGVDNPGAVLANVVGETSTVKLGPLSVPLRPLATVLERSIQKRRLSSSLHRTGNRLTLLANMPGAEGNWCVEHDLSTPASAEDTAGALRAMAEELVYRVFATMVPTGSKKWEAVKWFSEGLRAYRHTLTTDMNRHINLRAAERHFLAARGIDKHFARCTYNLGIVYRNRGRNKAAIAAFEQAIQDNPASADAAYALSLIHMQAEQFARALEFAERAIAHAPRDMRAWTMKGYVRRWLQTEPKSGAAWRSSLKFRETAAALAWRDLCRAAWRGQPLDASRKALVDPFINLAVAQLELDNPKQFARIVRQAIWQRPEARLYFELGKGLRRQGAMSRAALSRALKIYQVAVHFTQTDFHRALYHAYIAETSALIATFWFERMLVNVEHILSKYHVESFLPESMRRRIGAARRTALQAYKEVLASPSIMEDNEVRLRLSEACQALREVHRCRIIERIGKALDALKVVPNETGAQRLERIRQAVKNCAPSLPEAPEVIGIIAWTRAVFIIEIGYLLMQDQPSTRTFRRSERFLRYGVSSLEKHYPAEQRLGFANELLAEALRMQSKFIEALAFAERAAALNPFSPGAIRQLGLVHSSLANYDQAEQELQKSFEFDPSNVDTLRCIGTTSWSRGAALTNREERSSEFRKVIRTFDAAVSLAGNDSDRGWLHFWLGRFHGDLMEYDSSARHYQMARALGAYPIECYLYLGWAAIEQELFDQAEKHLRKGLLELFQAQRGARQTAAPISRTNWWRTPRTVSEGAVPPGYFLLNVCLLLALVFAERGGDIARARRLLRFVDRHRHLLGEPPLVAGVNDRWDFERRRREIGARYEDYLGWVYHIDDQPRQAREHIEASVKMRENPESLYHLAQVYQAKGATDSARDCCKRARTTDLRGVFAARITRIEVEASRPA